MNKHKPNHTPNELWFTEDSGEPRNTLSEIDDFKIEQAIEPVCKTCKDNPGSVMEGEYPDYYPIPCPDCQKPESDSDFIKRVRENIKHTDNEMHRVDKFQWSLIKPDLEMLCDKLDATEKQISRLQAQNKHLKEVIIKYENIMLQIEKVLKKE